MPDVETIGDMNTPTANNSKCVFGHVLPDLSMLRCGKVAAVVKTELPVPDALPVGTRLMDYDIDGLLGVGGFGIVYRAREASLQRQVAIKEYLPSSLASRGPDGQVTLRAPQHEEPFVLGLRSFVNEARLLARFDHPALVRVIRFWEERGTAYMVMPCYEGLTLYEARKALSGPPDEVWLRALMEPLLGALDCLHREQVFHRDVAPDNILIIPDVDAPAGFRPVLLDFGAARRVISDHTQALTAILKPSFAPIEQYAETTQLRQGPWTDLYGLGAVLHYCITGRTPVPATARAVHDDLPSLRQMAPALSQDFGRHYSPALLAAIDRALAVRPEDRPASVAAWRDALVDTPRTIDLSASPSDGVRSDPPAAAGSEGGAARETWHERTVMVSRPGGDPLHQGPRADPMPMSDLFQPPHQPAARRAWWWGAGALALASVVALSAWTVRRDAQRMADAGAAPTAEVAGPTVATAPANGAIPAAAPETGERTATPKAPRERDVDGARPRSVSGDDADARDRPADARPSGREAERQRSGSGGTEGGNRATRSTAGPLNPREACGGRVFIALAICMKRYCGRQAYAAHPECTRMRQQEEAQRQRVGGVPP